MSAIEKRGLSGDGGDNRLSSRFFMPESKQTEQLDFRELYKDADAFREGLGSIFGYPLSNISSLYYQPNLSGSTEERFVEDISPHAVGAEAIMLAFDARHQIDGWYKWHIAADFGTRQYTLAMSEHGRGYGVLYTRSAQNRLVAREACDDGLTMNLHEMVCMLRDHSLTQKHLARSQEIAVRFTKKYMGLAASIIPDAPTGRWVGLGEARRQQYLSYADWAADLSSQ